MALAGLLATAPTAAWASSPRLGEAELESLRDTLAASAPAGSVTYLDKTNSTIMRVPGKRTPALASAIGRRGTQVSVTEETVPVVTRLMLHGGMHVETAFQERFCSTGFITEGGGWRWMVTAGHCVKGGAGNTAYWYTQGGYEAGGLIGVGTILDPSFPGDQSAYGVLSGSSLFGCGNSGYRSYYQPLGEVLTPLRPHPGPLTKLGAWPVNPPPILSTD